MTLFDTACLLDDFAELRPIVFDYLASVPDEAWSRRTGTRDKDWTLHETLAHLVAIGRLFNAAVAHALAEKPLVVDGLKKRTDLRAFNTWRVAELSPHPPAELQAMLATAWDEAEARTRALDLPMLRRAIHVPVYDQPITVFNCLEWQLTHVGVIHGAQITRPVTEPLWTRYPADLTHHLIDRYLRHFSAAYWPDYGDGQRTVLNITVGGEAGGQWHIVAAPEGGQAAAGAADDAAHSLWFAGADALFGLFGFELDFRTALRQGLLKAEGDFKAAFRLVGLFSPGPPRVA